MVNKIKTFSDWFDQVVRNEIGDKKSRLFYLKAVPGNSCPVWEERSIKAVYRDTLSCVRGLEAIGLEKGMVVAFISPNSLEWDILHFACLIRGAAVLGVDFHAPSDHQSMILEMAKPKCLFVDKLSRLNSLDLHTELRQAQIITCEESDHSIYREEAPVHTFSDLCKHAPPLESITNYGVKEDDPAIYIFTSGTTGKPKGICYTHRQLIMALDALSTHYADDVGRLKSRVMACWMPLSNAFQRMINLFALKNGFDLYYCPDPKNFVDLLPSIRPSVLAGVPRLYEKIVQNASARVSKLPAFLKKIAIRYVVGPAVRKILGGRIEVLISGSSKMPAFALDFFEAIDLPLFELYGMSENLIPIAGSNGNNLRKGSVGKLFQYNQVEIGPDGEILVRSPGNGALFSTSPVGGDKMVHSGDLGYFDADGFLYVQGRFDNIIKTSTGVRVSAGDIEDKLSAISGVDQVMVVGNARKVLSAIIVSSLPPNLLSTYIANINSELPSRLHVCGVILTQTPFSMTNKMATPNLKLRRRHIESSFSSAIEDLYLQIENTSGKTLNSPAPIIMIET